MDELENGAAPYEGLISDFFRASSRTTIVLATVLLGSLGVLPLLNRFLAPTLDAREPPVLKPRIPFIGHIISLIRHQNEFQPVLHKANPSVPIATLPMLNGKMYTVFDPYLIQAALRNKTASFEPFVVDFAQKSFGLSDQTFAKITSQPGLVPDFTDAIHRSFQPAALQAMNVHFLGSISEKLDAIVDGSFEVDVVNAGGEKRIKGGLEVGNLYLWCRDVMTLATTRALYGEYDPFRKDPTLVEKIWTFEESVPFFLMSLFPSVTMPKGYQARQTLQRVLTEYYVNETDLKQPRPSTLVMNRSRTLRDHGFTGAEIAKLEAVLPMVATTNAIPTFFWMLLFILSRQALVARLRAEAEAAAVFVADEKTGKRTARFNIGRFDEQLPLMISCYRETMRVVNHSVSMRRGVEDITLTAQDGRSYLLKKGIDIQLSAGVTHSSAAIWGADAADFDPERFLAPGRDESGTAAGGNSSTRSSEADRRRKAAFIPFGGGKHLCPGRNLAFCEILGFMCSMLLRFDVEPLGMPFGELGMSGAKLSAPSCKPVGYGAGLGAKITTSPGWEGTGFEFVC